MGGFKPRNLQQDPLTGPLNLSRYLIARSQLRGQLVRSRSIFDGFKHLFSHLYLERLDPHLDDDPWMSEALEVLGVKVRISG